MLLHAAKAISWLPLQPYSQSGVRYRSEPNVQHSAAGFINPLDLEALAYKQFSTDAIKSNGTYYLLTYWGWASTVQQPPLSCASVTLARPRNYPNAEPRALRSWK